MDETTTTGLIEILNNFSGLGVLALHIWLSHKREMKRLDVKVGGKDGI